MKLSEALAILRQRPDSGPAFEVRLACGFSPLHLQTFLTANLQQRLPDRPVSISAGVFGDIAGTLEGSANESLQAIAIALEWQDLDRRLGFRETVKWGTSALVDIVAQARGALARLRAAIAGVSPGTRFALLAPSLPLPPLFHTRGSQSSAARLALDELLAEFLAGLANSDSRVQIVDQWRLAECSPVSARLDMKSELLHGFPYTLAHASAVANMLAELLRPPPAKKGLITDLDNTLWRGIVGEIGAAQVAWDNPGHAQQHGLYQSFLGALADEGVLLAIASKNDRKVVDAALAREDLVVPVDRIFPIEAHWQEKSGSIRRILSAWNISPADVVFVDDSPMELAEVAAAFPDLTCLRFPADDPAAALALLRELRELFGRPQLSDEDRLRMASIRNAGELQEQLADSGQAAESFLAGLDAKITLDFAPDPNDARVLELVNKTNQFNLNGQRLTEADWRQRLGDPASFVAAVSYEDRLGPLGKIAVIQGRHGPDRICIDAWVMSCRAFARRIEHQCLTQVFTLFNRDRAQLAFTATGKNGPISSFVAASGASTGPSPVELARAEFLAHCPVLHHKVSLKGAERHG